MDCEGDASAARHEHGHVTQREGPGAALVRHVQGADAPPYEHLDVVRHPGADTPPSEEFPAERYLPSSIFSAKSMFFSYGGRRRPMPLMRLW